MVKNSKKQIKNMYKTQLVNNILKYSNLLWIPLKDSYKPKVKIKTNSWFNMFTNDSKIKYNQVLINNKNIYSDEIIKCKKVILYPNKVQQKIFHNWIFAYINMYNETIKIIKKQTQIQRIVKKLYNIKSYKRKNCSK